MKLVGELFISAAGTLASAELCEDGPCPGSCELFKVEPETVPTEELIESESTPLAVSISFSSTGTLCPGCGFKGSCAASSEEFVIPVSRNKKGKEEPLPFKIEPDIIPTEELIEREEPDETEVTEVA